MRIEEKKALVRRFFPSWLVSLAIFVVGGSVVLIVFHGYREGGALPSESGAWLMVLVGMLVGYLVSWASRRLLLQKVREWHEDEKEVRDELERAAADYLALSLALPIIKRECLVSWHNAWEELGLLFLAKEVQVAAERQRIVQQNLRATREEEKGANRQYDVAASKFYATRDALSERGSKYAKSLLRWSGAL